jgi:hypothetical protein
MDARPPSISQVTHLRREDGYNILEGSVVKSDLLGHRVSLRKGIHRHRPKFGAITGGYGRNATVRWDEGHESTVPFESLTLEKAAGLTVRIEIPQWVTDTIAETGNAPEAWTQHVITEAVLKLPHTNTSRRNTTSSRRVRRASTRNSEGS